MRGHGNQRTASALQPARSGDVIVRDAGGDLANALIGEIMVGHALKIGVAGIVIDGAIRDVDALCAGPLPVFAAGVTHRGPYKDGPAGFDGDTLIRLDPLQGGADRSAADAELRRDMLLTQVRADL